MITIENTQGKYIHQHYVPKFLLNKFGREIKPDLYKIRGFDLKTSKQVEGSTKGFCVEKNFYDKTDPKNTEQFLKKIDMQSSKIINKITENKSLQDINKEQIAVIKEFAFYQIIRTRYMRNEYKIFIKKRFNTSDEEAEELANIFQNSAITMDPRYPMINNTDSKKTFIDFRDSFMVRFEKFNLLLMSIENSDIHLEFYLSDNPVFVVEPKRKQEFKYDYDDNLLYFPLSPKLCLVFYDDNIQMKRFKKLLNIKNNFYPIYYNEKSIRDVEEYNYKAIMNSFRFIFFKTGHIGNLKKMIKTNPDLKNVNRQRIL